MQLSVYLQVLGTFDWKRWGELILKHYPLLLFLRWGETGSSVDDRDSGFFCWKQRRASVVLSFLPGGEGESAEQGSCLLQSDELWMLVRGWSQGPLPRGVHASTASGIARRNVQTVAGRLTVFRGLMGLDESPLSGRTQRGLTYYAIKFWKDCYIILVSTLHPNG